MFNSSVGSTGRDRETLSEELEVVNQGFHGGLQDENHMSVLLSVYYNGQPSTISTHQPYSMQSMDMGVHVTRPLLRFSPGFFLSRRSIPAFHFLGQREGLDSRLWASTDHSAGLSVNYLLIGYISALLKYDDLNMDTKQYFKPSLPVPLFTITFLYLCVSVSGSPVHVPSSPPYVGALS